MGAGHSWKKKSSINVGGKKNSGEENGRIKPKRRFGVFSSSIDENEAVMNIAKESKDEKDINIQRDFGHIRNPAKNIFDYKINSIKMKYQNGRENREMKSTSSIKEWCKEDDYPSKLNPFAGEDLCSLNPFAIEEGCSSGFNPFESENIVNALSNNQGDENSENISNHSLLLVDDKERNNSSDPVVDCKENGNNFNETENSSNALENKIDSENRRINSTNESELLTDEERNMSNVSVCDHNNLFLESENTSDVEGNLKNLKNSNLKSTSFISLLTEHADKRYSDEKNIAVIENINSGSNNQKNETSKVNISLPQDIYLTSENVKNTNIQPEVLPAKDESQYLNTNNIISNCNMGTDKENVTEKRTKIEFTASAENHDIAPDNEIPPNFEINIVTDKSTQAEFLPSKEESEYLNKNNDTFNCNTSTDKENVTEENTKKELTASAENHDVALNNETLPNSEINIVTASPIPLYMQGSSIQLFKEESTSIPLNSKTLIIHQEKHRESSRRYRKKYRAPDPPNIISRTQNSGSQSLLQFTSATASSSKQVPDTELPKEANIVMPSDSKSSVCHPEQIRKSISYGQKRLPPDPADKLSRVMNSKCEIRYQIHRPAPPPPVAVPVNLSRAVITPETKIIPAKEHGRKTRRKSFLDLFKVMKKKKEKKCTDRF